MCSSNDSLIALVNDQYSQGSNSENRSEADINSAPKEKTKADYVQDLLAVHQCDKHGKQCLALPGRDHYGLAMKDIHLWATLLVCSFRNFVMLQFYRIAT